MWTSGCLSSTNFSVIVSGKRVDRQVDLKHQGSEGKALLFLLDPFLLIVVVDGLIKQWLRTCGDNLLEWVCDWGRQPESTSKNKKNCQRTRVCISVPSQIKSAFFNFCKLLRID